MAEIKNRFVLFNTRANFEAEKANITSESIVFIADQQKIYTQGKFFTKDAFSKYQVGNSEVHVQNDGWDEENESELAEGILKFVAGKGLEATVGANGEITYSLKTGEYSVTTSNGTNNGKFIKNITTNEFGQVLTIEYADIVQNSYDLTSATNAEGNTTAKITFSMTDALNSDNNKKTDIIIKGKESDKITVAPDASGNIEISHNKPADSFEITGAIAIDGEVEVINGLTNDAWGHLIAATKVTAATKSYVDSQIDALEGLVGTSVEAALILQGVATQASDLEAKETGDHTYTPKRGHTWKVGASFEFTNAEGKQENVKAGDVIICVSDSPVKWSAIQSNVDIAGDALGLVKAGSNGAEGSRVYGVDIDTNGAMTVTVPAQHIPTVSSKVAVEVPVDEESGNPVENKVVIKHIDVIDGEEKETSSQAISGSGAVKVSANASGDIEITATDNDTTYTLTYLEDASGSTISITPTKFINGVQQSAGTAQSFTVSAWGYPDLNKA